jgi:hypothetical protein
MRLRVLLVGLVLIAYSGAFPGRALALSPTFGWLDNITLYTDGTLRVEGWAATSDYPTTPLGIRVLIDGQHAIPNFRSANEYRPDVGAAYPGYGNYHGFNFTVPVPTGLHTVTIEAQNSGVYNTIDGSRTYNLTSVDRLFRGGSILAIPGSAVPQTYWRSISNPYASNIDWAASKWNNTATYLDLTYTSSESASKVRFYTGTYTGDWPAVTYTHYCANPASLNITGCAYAVTNIYFDTADMTSYPTKVAAHEFGHAWGLAHPPSNFSSVMLGGAPGGLVVQDPSAQDTARFNRLYPLGLFDTP